MSDPDPILAGLKAFLVIGAALAPSQVTVGLTKLMFDGDDPPDGCVVLWLLLTPATALFLGWWLYSNIAVVWK